MRFLFIHSWKNNKYVKIIKKIHSNSPLYVRSFITMNNIAKTSPLFEIDQNYLTPDDMYNHISMIAVQSIGEVQSILGGYPINKHFIIETIKQLRKIDKKYNIIVVNPEYI